MKWNSPCTWSVILTPYPEVLSIRTHTQKTGVDSTHSPNAHSARKLNISSVSCSSVNRGMQPKLNGICKGDIANDFPMSGISYRSVCVRLQHKWGVETLFIILWLAWYIKNAPFSTCADCRNRITKPIGEIGEKGLESKQLPLRNLPNPSAQALWLTCILMMENVPARLTCESVTLLTYVPVACPCLPRNSYTESPCVLCLVWSPEGRKVLGVDFISQDAGRRLGGV